MRILLLLLVSGLLYSCGNTEQPAAGKQKQTDQRATLVMRPGDKQLNISILWDLSDRVDTTLNKSQLKQYEKDIGIMQAIAELFKSDMKGRGTYKAKGKYRVFFSPAPNDPAINIIAGKLVYDLGGHSDEGANKQKKEFYDSIQQWLAWYPKQIFDLVVSGNKGNKQWPGSDIWSFFKDDVKRYCVEKDTAYRNILVILTDGYIYHDDSKIKSGKRTSYILSKDIGIFRNHNSWEELFRKGNYGLISTRSDLQNLEVLVLEINPTPGNKKDADIIKAYLGQWFEEMGVKPGNYACYNTDLPEYTRPSIQDFFNR